MQALRKASLALLVSFTLTIVEAGQVPDTDRRNTEIRHTDRHYQMPEYSNLHEWQERAAFLKKQILFSAGLLPMPEKTPLNAQVFGKIEHEDYSIEKVLLETYPGFFLGGNLYRPVGKPGPYPGIVSPHGHWAYGRLENQPLGSVPARGISLARQGYIVLTYDMVGYNDTVQLPHGFAGPRENLWGIGVLGLQLWNSIRAVDFLSSLSDVDPNRLAATGASGGGTQTFLLAAVDDRIKYAAPVNMISVIMQGGSRCENAPNLRIDTFNVEIGALIAPRPLLMVSATGDWTKNTPREEFPAIQSIYRLFQAEQQVETVQFDAPHNYHQGSREAVYAFFGKKILGDANPENFRERSYSVEQLSSMLSLWGRALPEHAADLPRFISQRIEQAERHTDELKPHNRASLERARDAFHERLALSTMARPPAPNELASDLIETLPNGEMLVIGRRAAGDRIPAVILELDKRRRRRSRELAPPPTLLVHPEGTAWVLSSAESLDGFVYGLLDRGGSVMGIDAFQTGRAKAPRHIAAAGQYAEKFYTTFNRSDDANRVQDILTALTYLRTRLGSQQVNLVGMGDAGLWCVFARALAGGEIRLAADLAQFDAASDDEFERRFFIPGIRRAGDFRAAATLLPVSPVLLHNVHAAFPVDWLRASFDAAGASDSLDVREARLSETELLNWLAPDPRLSRRGR